MLLKKNSITHLSIQRVPSWCIMDSLRSLTNSKGILLCPSACIHFRLTILALWPVCLSVSSTGKQEKICHWRETHHQVHCTFSRKQLVAPIRKTVMCHSWNPIGAAWSRSISLLCCPVVGQLPCFTCEHIRPVECTGHRVCFKHSAGQASRQAQSYLLGRCEVWLLTFLPTGACSAFQHS